MELCTGKNAVFAVKGRTAVLRQAFYPVIHGLLVGKLTPEQAAANIDEACNKAVRETGN